MKKLDKHIVINKMLKIAGYYPAINYEYLVNNKEYGKQWYTFLSYSEKDEEKFNKWLIKKLIKHNGLSKDTAEKEASMIILDIGLRVKYEMGRM